MNDDHGTAIGRDTAIMLILAVQRERAERAEAEVADLKRRLHGDGDPDGAEPILAAYEAAHRYLDEHDAVELLGLVERIHRAFQRRNLKVRKAAAEVARLRDLLRPFARFAEQFDRQPLKGLSDRLYGIHAGSEYEAELTLSDCRAARDALSRKGT